MSQHYDPTPARPYHLFLEPLQYASPHNVAAAMHAAAWVDDGRPVLLVTTRDTYTRHKLLRVARPTHDMTAAISWLQLQQRGRDHGHGVLVIDAEPVWTDDGRAWPTIRAAQVEALHTQLATALHMQLHAVQIFLDAAQMPQKTEEATA